MIDTKALFDSAWAEELAVSRDRSPTYEVGDYSVTGKAAAKYGGKKNLLWWEENGPLLVDAWVEWRKKTRWELWETPEGKPAIELEFNIMLPGDIPVKMLLDRVFVTPVGEIVVVDLKTGSRMPETPEQLGLYATGMELTFGPHLRPTWGFWWNALKGTHSTPFNLDMYTPSFFAEMYKGAIAGINAGSFLPEPKNGCSSWCGASAYCAATQGSKARGVDPLLSA